MRKPMVTRTIKTTVANVMCLNIETGEPFNKTVEVPRTYTDENKLMKAVKAVAETDVEKCVHIVDVREKESLYGMTEEDFLKNAQLMPARGTTETQE